MNQPAIKASGLSKTFDDGRLNLTVLDAVLAEVDALPSQGQAPGALAPMA